MQIKRARANRDVHARAAQDHNGRADARRQALDLGDLAHEVLVIGHALAVLFPIQTAIFTLPHGMQQTIGEGVAIDPRIGLHPQLDCCFEALAPVDPIHEIANRLSRRKSAPGPISTKVRLAMRFGWEPA